ncbi:phosphorylase kinase gamma, testis subunit [Ectocarpus siliculosus]|uniref:Phosphorylase kinase gamma, testis subunit n=1 Tax=Ectocarpus siliculosus TaxID=2880 RepID=D7FNA7_ECTSI|nr:phosphorylase kinase gamma, testis subunit [Ectocarpus siliculosus]|eukprot:CBJ30164.1 phosphorylase kinase gamma, testis subunit [Ectocarpus siliculosus]
MSTLPRGVHVASNTPVAIKVIDPLARPNAERARKLFEREVNLHGVVTGLPNVIRLLGASTPTSTACCYLATEFATKGDLFNELRRRRALPENVVREVIMQLIIAVAGLHRNNICHRDIKPENILLKHSDVDPRRALLKLADFGHAGLVPADSMLFTRDCGTPGYKAPELRSEWKHGHGLAADLWSVGAVMNDCFSFKCRQPPVGDNTFWDRDVWETVSTHARNLLGRLLEADPRQRISAEEALQHPWIAGALSQTVYREIPASEGARSGEGEKSNHSTHRQERRHKMMNSEDPSKKKLNVNSGVRNVAGQVRIPSKVLKTERRWVLKPYPEKPSTSASEKQSNINATTDINNRGTSKDAWGSPSLYSLATNTSGFAKDARNVKGIGNGSPKAGGVSTVKFSTLRAPPCTPAANATTACQDAEARVPYTRSSKSIKNASRNATRKKSCAGVVAAAPGFQRRVGVRPEPEGANPVSVYIPQAIAAKNTAPIAETIEAPMSAASLGTKPEALERFCYKKADTVPP